ncbi:unnamed protein product, partial [Ranitomeya imitator]
QETHGLSGEDLGVNLTDFQVFLAEASELQLEEVLTFYTHKNKSASVFLGGSPCVETDGPQADSRIALGAPGTCSPQEGQCFKTSPPSLSTLPFDHLFLSTVLPPSSDSHTVCSSSEAVAALGVISSNHRSRPLSSSSLLQPPSTFAQSASGVPRLQSCRLGLFSSFQSAAQIYSQRLSRAGSTWTAISQPHVLRTRSRSAGALRELEDPYHVGAVTASLQRLAERRARPSSSSHRKQLTQQLSRMNISSSSPPSRAGLCLTRAVHTEEKHSTGDDGDSSALPTTCSSAATISTEQSHDLEEPPDIQHGRLEPAPPTTPMGGARKLCPSRSVRVVVSDKQKNPGIVLVADPEAAYLHSRRTSVTSIAPAGLSDATQIVFARSRPPVPPPRTPSAVQKRRVVCPT